MKTNKIVKAEILISRKCHLKCTGCAMATGYENTRTIEEWKEGLLNAMKLGCKFFAFYGAEPFEEFEKLAELVSFSENELKIPCTVITNGVDVFFEDKLRYLYRKGLKSLTMSYTPATTDKAVSVKSDQAKKYLEEWANLKGIRDAAAVVTITPENFHLLPATIEMMSGKGIWTFFDIMQFDIGKIGSKCAEYISDLDVFRTFKYELFEDIFKEIDTMSREGFLVHPTTDYFMRVLNAKKTGKLWNCADYDEFPSWITIDCDGSVRPCDDFCEYSDLDMLNLYKGFDEWSIKQKESVKNKCTGCLWCTHIQAHSIKKGVLSINKYIH